MTVAHVVPFDKLGTTGEKLRKKVDVWDCRVQTEVTQKERSRRVA
jgi:hypothetical protein